MIASVRCDTIDVRLEGDLGPFSASLTCVPDTTAGVFRVELSAVAEAAAPLPDVRLAWDLPSVDFHYKWNPRCMQNRALDIAEGSYNHVDSSELGDAGVQPLQHERRERVHVGAVRRRP